MARRCWSPALKTMRRTFTRFHLLRRSDAARIEEEAANKISLAFAVEHRPGTWRRRCSCWKSRVVDLTKIESRPVPGSPWEYIFYVDFRFDAVERAERALAGLHAHCRMVKELGRYAAAA